MYVEHGGVLRIVPTQSDTHACGKVWEQPEGAFSQYKTRSKLLDLRTISTPQTMRRPPIQPRHTCKPLGSTTGPPPAPWKLVHHLLRPTPVTV